MPASLSIPFASAITTTTMTTTTPTMTSRWRRKLEALSFLPANFRMQFAYIISNNVSTSRTCFPDRDTLAWTRRQLELLFLEKRREVVLLQTRTVEQTCMIVAAGNLPSERNFTILFSFSLPNKLGRSFSEIGSSVYFCLCYPFSPLKNALFVPTPPQVVSHCLDGTFLGLLRTTDRTRRKGRSVPARWGVNGKHNSITDTTLETSLNSLRLVSPSRDKLGRSTSKKCVIQASVR